MKQKEVKRDDKVSDEKQKEGEMATDANLAYLDQMRQHLVRIKRQNLLLSFKERVENMRI
jgi:hypothetical protein